MIPIAYSTKYTKINDIYKVSLAVVCLNSNSTNMENTMFKIFLWVWDDADKGKIDGKISEVIHTKNMNYIYAPYMSFILDNSLKTNDYKELCLKISSDFKELNTTFDKNDYINKAIYMIEDIQNNS